MAQVLACWRKKNKKKFQDRHPKEWFLNHSKSLLNGRKSFMKGYNSNDLSGKSFGVFIKRLLMRGGYI